MPITPSTRVLNGTTYSVSEYTDLLYRLDDEDDDRPYSSAPYKYFSTTREEAITGYSNRFQILRAFRPRRALVLLNMFDPATRAAVMARVPASVQANIEGSFPYQNGVMNRVSEEDNLRRNYNVINALCDLYADIGIDGYYVPRSASLHSEVALCGRTMAENVLEMVENRRVATKQVRRRPPVPRAVAAAPPSPILNRQGLGFQSRLLFANAELNDGNDNYTVGFMSPPSKRPRFHSPTRLFRRNRSTRKRSRRNRRRATRQHQRR